MRKASWSILQMGRKERRTLKRETMIRAMLDGTWDKDAPLEPEIDMFFADDARQNNPTRPGMKSLVAIGGINAPAEEVGNISRTLDDICTKFGFPANQE